MTKQVLQFKSVINSACLLLAMFDSLVKASLPHVLAVPTIRNAAVYTTIMQTMCSVSANNL